MRPRSGAAVISGASDSTSGAGAWGSVIVTAGGLSPPQAARASNPTSRHEFRACSAPLLHQIPETVKVGLQFLRDNPPQDAGLHQRCQDPGQFIADTELHH